MSLAWTAVALVAVSAATTYYSGQQQVKAQEKAANQAREDATKAEKLQTEATNAQNRKKADVSALLQNNQGGGSPTLLTGPQGVSPDQLGLSKNSLLGS